MSTRKLTLSLFAAAAMGFGGAAHAADVYVPPVEPEIAVPAPAAWDWTGLYFGVNAGYGWGHADCVSCSPDANDFPISGVFAGGQIGVNWQIGGLVVGVEGDAQWSGITGSCDGAGECNGPPQMTTQDLDWFGTVRGRLGFAAGQLMPYVTGGWAFGSGTRTTTSGGGDVATASHSGWVWGAGLEWMVSQGWTAKLEFQQLNFGASQYVFPNIGGPDPTVSMSVSTIRVGINKLF
jgi:outer membrane immunogenic protein